MLLQRYTTTMPVLMVVCSISIGGFCLTLIQMHLGNIHVVERLMVSLNQQKNTVVLAYLLIRNLN